jgi:hypothetical protein
MNRPDHATILGYMQRILHEVIYYQEGQRTFKHTLLRAGKNRARTKFLALPD